MRTPPADVWHRLIDSPACRMRTLLDDDSDADLHDDWLTLDERAARDNWNRQRAVAANRDLNLRPDQATPAIERENVPRLAPIQTQDYTPAHAPAPSTPPAVIGQSPRAPPSVRIPPPTPPRMHGPAPPPPVPPPVPPTESPPDLRRSLRAPKNVQRFDPAIFVLNRLELGKTMNSANWLIVSVIAPTSMQQLNHTFKSYFMNSMPSPLKINICQLRLQPRKVMIRILQHTGRLSLANTGWNIGKQ